MTNTKAGGERTAHTNKRKYGKDFYAVIGAEGGRQKRPRPFENSELARRASQLGVAARKRKREESGNV